MWSANISRGFTSTASLTVKYTFFTSFLVVSIQSAPLEHMSWCADGGNWSKNSVSVPYLRRLLPTGFWKARVNICSRRRRMLLFQRYIHLYICIVHACVTLSYIDHVSLLFALVGLKITCHYLLTEATDPDRNCADVGHSQPHWRRMRRKYLRRSFSRFWEHACLAFSLCFQMQVPSKTGNVKTLWGMVNLCRMRRRSQQIFFKIFFLKWDI